MLSGTGHGWGMCGLSICGQSCRMSALIQVLPEYRRQGVGKALLRFIEAFLRDAGHEALYSSSQADEPEPQAWHRYMGFEECGFIAGINDGVGEVFFRKSLR